MLGIILKPGETVVASSEHHTSGKIGWFGGGVFDAYDVYLLRVTGGDYILAIFMKLQFLFEDAGKQQWGEMEKEQFTRDFETAITRVWGNRYLKTLSTGKRITLEFRFEMLIDRWSITEHWEIHVKKIAKGLLETSSVQAKRGRVDLDSEDFTGRYKGRRVGYKKYQRGAVHEFGHMLGLDDEYEVTSKYHKEYDSIMNIGETVKYRHQDVYMSWLDKVLVEKNMK